MEELHPVRGEGKGSVQEFAGCQVQAQLVGLDLIPRAFGFARFAVAPVLKFFFKKSLVKTSVQPRFCSQHKRNAHIYKKELLYEYFYFICAL